MYFLILFTCLLPTELLNIHRLRSAKKALGVYSMFTAFSRIEYSYFIYDLANGPYEHDLVVVYRYHQRSRIYIFVNSFVVCSLQMHPSCAEIGIFLLLVSNAIIQIALL